jgi:hypothetical protein
MSDYYPDPPMPLFELAKRSGVEAAAACAAKAERVTMFDTELAREEILAVLTRSAAAMSGEELVDHCQARGLVPHDSRAFGAVFGALSRAGLIEAVGFAARRKGHGTAGARLWRATNVAG